MLAVAAALFLTRPAAAIGDAEGCTDLDGVPIQYVIDYQSAIQGIFDNNCIACHSGDKPPAGLDLGAGGSWAHIVNVPSSQDPTFTRVIPDAPYQSLLFLKVNCDTPGVGHRMPFGQKPLSEDDQALLLDWIAGGAPSTTTDGIFRSGFELRG
ncbi:MAG: hypothetical protein ABI843_11965 [Dokdonella sp.]